METRRALGAAAFFMGYLTTFPIHAAFHIVQIQEVMAGANGNPAIQFIELTMLGPNENCQQERRHRFSGSVRVRGRVRVPGF
jgi:hypothetical protein